MMIRNLNPFPSSGEETFTILDLPERAYFFKFIYCFFTIYSRYIKTVISKRDGCEYLKQVSMVLWSSSNEILWPHSVESSSYFRLIEQVSD
jgi:hypothetical protein